MKPSIKIDAKNIPPHQSGDVSLVMLLTPYSPVTPMYTFSTASQNKYSSNSTLKKAGFNPLHKIASALQGSVWKVSSAHHDSESKTDADTLITYIVKIANKSLHNQSIAYVNGNQIKICENILNEAAILKYLTVNKPPISLIKFHQFFSDSNNYFLVLEDGGNSFFEFIKESHEYIKKGTIDIKEWHKFCKIAMKQMTNALDWLHNTANVCHLDFSLENIVISNIKTTVLCTDNIRKMVFSQEFQIKIIDFGLSEIFTSKNNKNQINFKCRKFVGKTQYNAPEVYARQNAFDARSADCYSLGVCFYIMFIGNPPYIEPSVDDILFEYISHGQIWEVLYSWGVTHYVNGEIVNLLLAIFQEEKYRLNTREIQQHCWLQ